MNIKYIESGASNEDPKFDMAINLIESYLDMREHGFKLAPLNESVNITDLGEYAPLLEAVSAVMDMTQEDKEDIKEGKFDKIKQKFNEIVQAVKTVDKEKLKKLSKMAIRVVLIFLGEFLLDNLLHTIIPGRRIAIIVSHLLGIITTIVTIIIERKVQANELQFTVEKFDKEIKKIDKKISECNDPERKELMEKYKSTLESNKKKMVEFEDQMKKYDHDESQNESAMAELDDQVALLESVMTEAVDVKAAKEKIASIIKTIIAALNKLISSVTDRISKTSTNEKWVEENINHITVGSSYGGQEKVHTYDKLHSFPGIPAMIYDALNSEIKEYISTAKGREGKNNTDETIESILEREALRVLNVSGEGEFNKIIIEGTLGMARDIPLQKLLHYAKNYVNNVKRAAKESILLKVALGKVIRALESIEHETNDDYQLVEIRGYKKLSTIINFLIQVNTTVSEESVKVLKAFTNADDGKDDDKSKNESAVVFDVEEMDSLNEGAIIGAIKALKHPDYKDFSDKYSNAFKLHSQKKYEEAIDAFEVAHQMLDKIMKESDDKSIKKWAQANIDVIGKKVVEIKNEIKRRDRNAPVNVSYGKTEVKAILDKMAKAIISKAKTLEADDEYKELRPDLDIDIFEEHDDEISVMLVGSQDVALSRIFHKYLDEICDYITSTFSEEIKKYALKVHTADGDEGCIYIEYKGKFLNESAIVFDVEEMESLNEGVFGNLINKLKERFKHKVEEEKKLVHTKVMDKEMTNVTKKELDDQKKKLEDQFYSVMNKSKFAKYFEKDTTILNDKNDEYGVYMYTRSLGRINFGNNKVDRETLEKEIDELLTKIDSLNTEIFDVFNTDQDYYIEFYLVVKAKVYPKIVEATNESVIEFDAENIDSLNESPDKLSKAERDQLKASAFGLPEKRQYPIPDEKHLIKAIQFFHYCKAEDKEELAKNIAKQVKKLNLVGKVNVSPRNPNKKYFPEWIIKEAEEKTLSESAIFFDVEEMDSLNEGIEPVVLVIAGVTWATSALAAYLAVRRNQKMLARKSIQLTKEEIEKLGKDLGSFSKKDNICNILKSTPYGNDWIQSDALHFGDNNIESETYTLLKGMSRTLHTNLIEFDLTQMIDGRLSDAEYKQRGNLLIDQCVKFAELLEKKFYSQHPDYKEFIHFKIDEHYLRITLYSNPLILNTSKYVDKKSKNESAIVFDVNEMESLNESSDESDAVKELKDIISKIRTFYEKSSLKDKITPRHKHESKMEEYLKNAFEKHRFFKAPLYEFDASNKDTKKKIEDEFIKGISDIVDSSTYFKLLEPEWGNDTTFLYLTVKKVQNESVEPLNEGVVEWAKAAWSKRKERLAKEKELAKQVAEKKREEKEKKNSTAITLEELNKIEKFLVDMAITHNIATEVLKSTSYGKEWLEKSPNSSWTDDVESDVKYFIDEIKDGKVGRLDVTLYHLDVWDIIPDARTNEEALEKVYSQWEEFTNAVQSKFKSKYPEQAKSFVVAGDGGDWDGLLLYIATITPVHLKKESLNEAVHASGSYSSCGSDESERFEWEDLTSGCSVERELAASKDELESLEADYNVYVAIGSTGPDSAKLASKITNLKDKIKSLEAKLK